MTVDMSVHQTVRASPKRQNIYLSVHSRPSSMNIASSCESTPRKMFEDLRNPIDVVYYPKTVIYAKLDWHGYELFLERYSKIYEKFPVAQFPAPQYYRKVLVLA